MDGQQLQIMRSYLENTQITLETAHYTKVNASWKFDINITDVNRLYYIREGEGWIRVRNKLYHPKPGQLLLLPAGVRLAFGRLNDNGFGKYWCHFTATVGEVNLFQMLDLPYCIDVQDEPALEKKFQTLIALYQNPSSLTVPLRIKSLLLELVSDYVEASLGPDQGLRLAPTAETGKINTVLEYIEEHLQEQMTVEELARLVHFHPNYFMQYFKTMLGLSPIAYINRKRMDKAKELLMSTGLSVTDVAEKIGLELYYFSRLFKKQSGLSPTEYRKYTERRNGQEAED
ncbi:helix-turn-helix domain-containing protein [Paenibacillus allorhizosphaerae]|uniref:HTH-type transcriptional activator RhaS n=1 Tax=Paenibacillus allorhizosphaerae TaxID=2849866 RepID=A0ABN7TLG7_9BACL|nr:AraC family transcriptional regulator [Paenibacillus allorhizosphaerae]CAG7645577.1 HTH-type transcriptional activator RhaS [Paenibacillus allorhizosphaerae]